MAKAIVIPPPPIGDSISDLDADQLWNAQVLMALSCGRAKSTVRARRHEYYCFMQRVLHAEALARGDVPVTGHVTTGTLRA